MGGSQSQEFMVYTDAGEDLIVSCAESGYAANLEKATSQLTPVTEMEPTGDGMPELVHTPGKAAIADVAEFFKISPASDIKTVAYMGQKKMEPAKPSQVPVIAFLRGDHFVNETKLMAAAYVTELRTMVAEELALYFEGPAGYLGPIGLKVLPADKGDPRAAFVVIDQGTRRPQKHGRWRQQARLPLPQHHAWPRLHLDAHRRHPQRKRRRT